MDSTKHKQPPRADHLALINRYIRPITQDHRLIQTFQKVPRHLFVAPRYQTQAYQDHPLPIGHSQTVSQPSLVAQMIDHLQLKADHQVLEIGTGSGYQTALLAHLANHVYSIEIIPDLAQTARGRLQQLNLNNVTIITGDGSRGLPHHAPFDAIIAAAAAPTIPPALLEQLKTSGRLIIPTGAKDQTQTLTLVTQTPQGLTQTSLFPVRFVPLISQNYPLP